MSLLAPELTDSGLWLIFNFSSRAAVSSSEQVVSRVVKQWSAPETQPDAAHIWHAPSPGLHHHYLPAQSLLSLLSYFTVFVMERWASAVRWRAWVTRCWNNMRKLWPDTDTAPGSRVAQHLSLCPVSTAPTTALISVILVSHCPHQCQQQSIQDINNQTLVTGPALLRWCWVNIILALSYLTAAEYVALSNANPGRLRQTYN